MKKVYPIILTPTEKGFLVYVPDMDINTEGKNILDAIEMARDAIGLNGLALEDLGQKIPDIKTLNPLYDKDKEMLSFVDVDFDKFRKANDIKPVKKTLTIPTWLNEKAIEKNINFSAVLKEALIKEIQD